MLRLRMWTQKVTCLICLRYLLYNLSNLKLREIHILPNITLFRFITMLCGIDNIPQNISHIQSVCGEYLRISRGILTVPMTNDQCTFTFTSKILTTFLHVHTRQIQCLSLCVSNNTLVPQIIPHFTLTLLHIWYEECTPRRWPMQNMCFSGHHEHKLQFLLHYDILS